MLAVVEQDGVCDVPHGGFQNIGEVTARGVVCRGEEVHAMLVGLEVIAGAETLARDVVFIVHGYCHTALLAHDREAGDVCGAVADVDHVLKGDGAEVGIHVVVHVLGVVEHSLVDAEEKLCLHRVGNHALREVDVTVTFAELAGEHFFHVWADGGAIQQTFDAAGDDVVFHLDSQGLVLGGECAACELLKEGGDAREVGQFCPEFLQITVADAVDTQLIQQFFEVAQFTIPAVQPAAFVAFFPKTFRIDAKLGEDGFFLHVVRAERMVKIKDESDGGLGGWHALLIAFSRARGKKNQQAARNAKPRGIR